MASRWKRTAEGFELEATIPANTYATVYLPAQAADEITESGRPLSRARGVKLDRMENGRAVLEVVSGSYRFRSRPRKQGQ
jgi:alpha-L-rhamnosidase